MNERSFDKPTLFVKGEKSKYINRKNTDLIKSYFPQSQLEIVLGTGHWGALSQLRLAPEMLSIDVVHAEKPQEFQQLVSDFCNA